VRDSPGLEVRDYLLDHPADFVDLRVELLLPVQQLAARRLLEGVIIPFPTKPLSPIQLSGSASRRIPDSPRQ
jgi:hypothetical protein